MTKSCLRRTVLLAVWLCAFIAPLPAEGQRRVKTVFPEEHNELLTNPHMGWGLWAGPRYFDGRSFSLDYNTTGFGDDAPLFGWVLIDWMWRDLEPKGGEFYWKDLDTLIDYWARRGKEIELRIWITDDPGWAGAPGNEVCPDWLWASGVKYRAYVGEGKARKKEPDYTDPSYEKLYLPKARRFLEELAARYDRAESPVSLWGAMGYGQWGEWHTMWSHYPWPSVQVKHNVLAKIVAMYAEVFKVKPLVISYCFDDDRDEVRSVDDYLYRQALDVAIEKGFALARHGFIDGLLMYDRLIMERFWRTAMMWAEGNWSYTAVKNEGVHGTLEENIQVMVEWHSNYAHFYMDAASYRRAIREDKAAFENGLGSGGIGYRLVPVQLSWPEELPAGDLLMLHSTWVNRNAGRLYVRYPLQIYLTDANGVEKWSAKDPSFTQTNWVRGERYEVDTLLTTSTKLAPGEYDVRIAMVDAAGKPAIRLAIQGEDSQHRYKIGTLQIAPARISRQ